MTDQDTNRVSHGGLRWLMATKVEIDEMPQSTYFNQENHLKWNEKDFLEPGKQLSIKQVNYRHQWHETKRERSRIKVGGKHGAGKT